MLQRERESPLNLRLSVGKFSVTRPNVEERTPYLSCKRKHLLHITWKCIQHKQMVWLTPKNVSRNCRKFLLICNIHLLTLYMLLPYYRGRPLIKPLFIKSWHPYQHWILIRSVAMILTNRILICLCNTFFYPDPKLLKIESCPPHSWFYLKIYVHVHCQLGLRTLQIFIFMGERNPVFLSLPPKTEMLSIEENQIFFWMCWIKQQKSGLYLSSLLWNDLIAKTHP